MNDINDMTEPLRFLVGINGSGKTYALNEALKEQKSGAILITEDGTPILPKEASKVSINFAKMEYIYLDEKSRGQSGRVIEEESIQKRIRDVLLYCNNVKSKLDLVKNKSKGQEKLYNMMKIFLDHNLNHIRIIYFDEPENFLDEEFLKVIAEFFELLVNSGIVVRVATHNARLLNILKVSIEDITFLNAHVMSRITNERVKEIYHQTSTSIEKIRNEKNVDQDAVIKYKLSFMDNEEAYNNFLEQNLNSEEFYRCLFYREIFIVEGLSDVIALTAIKNEFENSIEIFSPDGKAFIPFFVELFLALNKEVTVIIDDDLTEDSSTLKHAVAITYYLEAVEGRGDIRLVRHSPDLEGFYGIDLMEAASTLTIPRNVWKKKRGLLKSLAAFSYFNNDENKIRLKEHILGSVEDSFEFK